VQLSDTAGSTPLLVMITGSAGSIGRATVGSFASRGYGVVACDRHPHPVYAADVAAALVVDLGDDDALGEAVEPVTGLGRLQHVVAVAGGGDAGELAQDDPATEPLEIFRRVLETNLVTAFATVRHTVPLLRRGQGDRSITLVGSINAFGGYGAPGYSAAKAGMSGLVNALADPLGAEGIRINCLALGTTDTDNLHELATLTGQMLDLSAMAAKAPLRRVLSPGEVGEALAVMAVDLHGLTGTTVVLDNGQCRIR
jgi:NAD(P)-dependent dehydrogenase (short-subunit alcohol dehydrogenase family)